MAKKENMKTRTDAELVKLLADAREELRTERFSAAGARAKESNAPRKLRTKIARVLTEQHARVLKLPFGSPAAGAT
jgi:ribosomal protein L29